MTIEGLAALEARIQRDHALTCFPEPAWVPPRSTAAGESVLDVLIVGAGQGGQAIATQLKRERVDNILVIDRAPAGGEGPWRTYARMQTLRTWKTVTGPDLGLPSLTFQAWYEAQFGAAAFAAMNKIPREMWHDYLLWLRRVLELPVRNGVELLRVVPDGGYLRAHLRADDGTESMLVARKVVLAMGIEKSGRWWMPPHVETLPARFRAHTADSIDLAALRGRRVAVLGAGASAFDNAAAALEAGAAEVRLFCRRPDLQRVQPYKAISFNGFLRHFADLPDAQRWRFMRHLLAVRESLPRETWDRVTRHHNFHLLTASPWESVRVAGGAVEIATPRGTYVADFLICGTGFEMDLACRHEIIAAVPHVATWADRYTPPTGDEDARLARYPYLGPGFELVEKTPGAAPWISDIHVFDFGTTMSFGPSGSSINGMKFAVPRLVAALTRDLFRADIEAHYARLLAYDTPEFPLTFARDVIGEKSLKLTPDFRHLLGEDKSMDLEPLVKSAQGGDVKAFVEITRRFQHFAFGSALALVHDFQQAEDVVQEAFIAAWASLPSLADPAAFPGWLRGIVRHQAFRVLRRKHLESLPLAVADDVPSDEPAADHRLDHRQQATAVLAAMGDLPAGQREVASLFFVHECSHQDIATFLGLSVTTVNNRLHAARTHLKRRMLTMVKATLGSHALPDDFANRIGRLVAARGSVVEALFNPDSLPDLMAELAVSDEANRRGITVQVVQRPGGGIVRGVAVAPVDVLPRGATVLDAGRPNLTPVSPDAFDRSIKLLVGEHGLTSGPGKLLETGIKVIDVMCPLVAGGTVAIAGEIAAGTTVTTEELVRRLSGGPDRLSLFTLVPPWPPEPVAGYSMAGELRKEGFSEGTVGAVQTFFLRTEDGPWTAQRLAALPPVDVVIHLSRAQAKAGIYPCVDPLTSRSRLLETGAVSHEHAAIGQRVRTALADLRQSGDRVPANDTDILMLDRARKVAQFFGQHFFVAEPYTKCPGTIVSLAETLRVCREILDGQHDSLPETAFRFAGGIADIRDHSAKP